MFIRRIKKLNAGIFIDYRPTNLPEFKKKNLIYGFNGSGKTTLARVLNSIQVGEVPHENWDFQLDTDAGEISERIQRDNVKVFDSNYIRENIDLLNVDGSSDALFLIGKEKIDDVAELEAFEEQISRLEENRTNQNIAVAKANNDLKDLKSEVAKKIKRDTGVPAYTAASLDGDIRRFEKAALETLEQTRLDEASEHARANNPMPRIEEVTFDFQTFRNLLIEVQTALETSLGKTISREISSSPEMLSWLKEGTDFHVRSGADICLFCENELSPTRLSVLENTFDKAYNDLLNQLTSLTDKALTQKNLLSGLNLPNADQFNRSLTEGAEGIKKKLEADMPKIEALLSGVIASLKAKQINISSSPAFPSNFEAAANSLETDLTALNLATSTHNASVAEFASLKESSKQAIIKHYVAEINPQIESIQNSISNFERAATQVNQGLNAIINQRDLLKASISNYELGAQQFNDLLRSFLGHAELSVEAVAEEGIQKFKLLRYGEAISSPPSEGEKSIIALVYFLISLEQETDQSNLVVVIDDPFSSTDGGYLLHGANEIKARTKNVGQTFYFTHNLSFMNQMKKWLRKKKKKSEDEAELFVIEANGGERRRFASLREMPPLLLNYDSEYEYCFSLVLSLAKSVDGFQHPNLFLMPNLSRKVLETFLSFRLPRQTDLPSQVNEIEDSGIDINAAELEALVNLANRESHANQMGAITEMPPIDEFQRLADAVMSLIKVMDEEHFNEMTKLCQNHSGLLSLTNKS